MLSTWRRGIMFGVARVRIELQSL